MSRLDVNRSGEIEVFVRAVELGGFSAAARAFHMTPSAVSKLVARLESRLGVRLINRSTRRLDLTAEGAAFLERGRQILEDLNTAEREAAAGAEPQGQLRINSNVPFGIHYLLPLLPGFLALYPKIKVDVALTDRVVDLIEERADIAIRTGPLRESRLIARKLGDSRMIIVAAPDYLVNTARRNSSPISKRIISSASASPAISRAGPSPTGMAAARPCRSPAMRW